MECQNTPSNKLSVCLNQHGPSWVGDLGGEESETREITYSNELNKDDERMQFFNQNFVLCKLSCDRKSRRNRVLCNTIVEQLISDVLNTISKTHIERKERNIRENLMSLTSKTCLNETSDVMESVLIPLNDNKLVSNSASNENNSFMKQEESEIEVLSDEEISRLDAMSMIPNCYNRSKITLTVPPLDLLPNRSWPKKKVYIIEIRRPNMSGVSLPDLDRNTQKDIQSAASIVTMDNDIEIIDVIPSKSFQRNTATEDYRETGYSQKNLPCDNMDCHQSTSCNIITHKSVFDANASKQIPSNIEFQDHTISELRKLVYKKMSGQLGNCSSRGFYSDSECLIEPSTKKLNVSRKRSRPEVGGDKLKSAESDHSLNDNVELDFIPSKRFPITSQHQCCN